MPRVIKLQLNENNPSLLEQIGDDSERDPSPFKETCKDGIQSISEFEINSQ